MKKKKGKWKRKEEDGRQKKLSDDLKLNRAETRAQARAAGHLLQF